MNEPWRITLFGGLSARQADKTITRFKSQKIAALLAYLALHLRQTHSREFLIELLWPEGTLDAGRNSLSVALSSLRHQFEPPGVPANSVIRADRFSVSLNPVAVTTDVFEFEQAIKEAARGANERDREEQLARAAELYGGRLLPHLYEEWITGEQERQASLFFDTSSRLVRTLEARGETENALAYARRMVSLEPLREEAQHTLIRLLDAAGQPGAALRQFKEFERLLDDEMADEPGADLRALARQIEKRSGLAAPVAVAAPPPVTPRQHPPATTGPTTVTFLITDIEGSTRDWEKTGDVYKQALTDHHRLLREAFTQHGGMEVSEAGDGFVVAFAGAVPALRCAVAAQQALASHTWPEAVGAMIRVRMALHSGDVEQNSETGEYRGLVLHRASRMLAAAHGGQTLLSEETAGLMRRGLPSGMRLLELGMFRLRDLPGYPPGAERLFQVEHPGMAQAAFPPLHAEAGHAEAGIPLTFTRFFGRERELARLGELLRLEQERLVTVTGPGGNGKSRLSIEAARRAAADTFSGAVWFVPLADISDPALIAGAILDALRVPRSPQQEPLEQAVAALSKQPALLVLDNFEQLVENGGPEVVQTLLQRVPSLTILTTSRQVLGLSAEREFVLSPLPTPHSGEDAAGLSAFDSVQLFIDRAQQVKPDFQVTNHNAAAVAELVSRLEGIPLAIELAAARAEVLTPTQMLAQMENRFAFLSGRKRDVVERHRTLQGAIDWSYQLLSPELQRFFCRLSVFRGGWTSEAAESVCEEPLALDYLAQLGECSLVLSEETEQGMRFRLLETLREFGQEHLAEEEKAANRRRHAQFFGQQMEERQEGRHGSYWEFERWAQVEHENIRQAIAWSLGSPADADLAGSLVYLLAFYRDSYGYYAENLRDLERALEREERMSPKVRCYTRYFHAWIFERSGMRNWSVGAADRERSLELMAEVLEIAREAGETRVQAMALNKLGRDDEALPLFEEIGDRWGIATALRDTAFRIYKSDPSGAEALYERVLAINREDNDTVSIIWTLNQMGVARQSMGDLAGARAAFDEGLRLHGPNGAPDGLAFILPHVARIARQQGDHGAACAYAERLLALRWPAGETERRIEALRLAVMTYRDAGDTEAARPLLEEYLAQSRAEDDKGRTAWALGVLGEMGGGP